MKMSQKMSPRRHLQGSAQDRFFFIHHKRGDVLLCVAYQGGSPPAHPGGSPPPLTSVQVKKKTPAGKTKPKAKPSKKKGKRGG